MFQVRKPQSGFTKTFAFFELLYNSIVRSVRKTGGNNAILGLLSNMVQTLTFILAFYFMFELIGLRGTAIHGADFLLYIMSGIFMFMTHTQAMSAVVGSEGPTSPMMQHAPMTTMLAILSSAIASLYTQLLTMIIVLFVYHVAITPLIMDDPVSAFGCVMLAWFTGCAVGMVFLAIKPWFPGFVGIASTIYQRVNMFASGKMFVGNMMPGFMLAMFDWNPLFHAIDQSRGYLFINYTPLNSSISYPIYVGLALVMIGLIGEHYTRQYASESWGRRG